MIRNASNKLEEQKEYVNSLNVFPVPDGDTGTNMSMTFKTAVGEVENLDKETVGENIQKASKRSTYGVLEVIQVLFYLKYLEV